MNIKVVNESGEEIKDAPVSNNPPNIDSPVDITKLEVQKMLESTEADSEDIDTLIKWAKLNTDDHSPEGIKWAIRNIETKTGTPPLGERAIPFYARFAYLNLESARINKEIENYKHL